ncbi:TlpA family protein disulfide reductase [Facklamia sp. 7083-14-GEN3]|uniref:TlpA family protein disulfide reductase n=1 Tax=Facklamia sp. 7083-14-GEN3 TaxID=2973478 RepID=UPI00215CCE26|nr:TlpA family protein disulfide reductase [Facklamia sp. 7083-14-GEN3]MCR8968400.1 TlpA family protein disulfide reductase [Facklamia sp. 7083-14-GEN3]
MKKFILILGVASITSGCALASNQKTTDSESNDSAQKLKKTKKASEESTMSTKKESAYDFTLKDLKGEDYSLADQKGKPVYVKFWASWCPVCLAGLEDLNTLASQDNDFEVVTIVSPGYNGEKNKEDFVEWFNSLEYDNMKVLLDEEGQTFADYGVRSMPTNALIDSQGVPVKIIPGEIRKETLTQLFEALTKEN